MFINQNFTTFVSSRVSSRFWWKHKYKITLFLTKCSWVFLRFSTQNFQFWAIVHWPNGVFGLQAGGSGTKLYPRYLGQRWDSLPILEQSPTIIFWATIIIVTKFKFQTLFLIFLRIFCKLRGACSSQQFANYWRSRVFPYELLTRMVSP